MKSEIETFIENWLEEESETLLAISEDYGKAKITGYFADRKIPLAMASAFEREYEIRSDAVAVIISCLLKDLKEKFQNY